MIEEHRAWARVQTRLVALTAQVLPSVAPVPPALRRIAAFAPARRAKAGGAALRSALGEDEFRGHVAVQVAALGEPADDLDRAAVLWLERPDGWEEQAQDLLDGLAAEVEDDRTAQEVDRLRAQVAALQAEVRDARAEQRDLDKAHRAEHSDLRRRLGEARAAQRAAEADAEAARGERDAAVRELDQERSRAETSQRRMQAQVDQAQAGASAARKDVRTEREAGQTRAWYLLDALVESAVGLRRELGLPAPAGAPADALEESLEGTDLVRGTRATTVGMLDNLLAVPQARLLVDGYNVTKTAWPTATLEAQRSRLVAGLAGVVARTGAETTVVFDAAASGSRPAMPTPRGVRVVFSPPGVIADDVIRQLVAAEPRGRRVVVVTNDREIVTDVTRQGARTVSSETFAEALRAV